MGINIAIDGLSVADKSTIAEILIRELGYSHLNIRATYRCTALASKKHGIDPDGEATLMAMLNEVEISLDPAGNVHPNDEDTSKQIRENEISMLTSNISAHSKVRKRLVALQQQVARDRGSIIDGHDIGTVVLPDAELKIYMVASVKTRADHRYKGYLGKHVGVNYNGIYRDIERRDYRDVNRKASPLRRAENVIEIDASNMTATEVAEEIRRNIPTLS